MVSYMFQNVAAARTKSHQSRGESGLWLTVLEHLCVGGLCCGSVLFTHGLAAAFRAAFKGRTLSSDIRDSCLKKERELPLKNT